MTRDEILKYFDEELVIVSQLRSGTDRLHKYDIISDDERSKIVRELYMRRDGIRWGRDLVEKLTEEAVTNDNN